MRKIEIELENLRHRLSKGGDNFLLFYYFFYLNGFWRMKKRKINRRS